MVGRVATLLALALLEPEVAPRAAPQARSGTAPATALAAAPAATSGSSSGATSGSASGATPRAAPAPCVKYRVAAERNDLVPEDEVAAWTTAALQRAARLDPASTCFVHVRITSIPIRTGGKQDGWVAHVSLSTRRYLRDGKLVTQEKGMLFVEAQREELVERVRTFVEEYASKLGQERPAEAPPAR